MCRLPVSHAWPHQGPAQFQHLVALATGGYLEVKRYPLDGAAAGVLLGERIIQGGQAAPLLRRPAPLRVWLQLQRSPKAVMVLVVVGVQCQQPPASMQGKR